MNIQIIDDPEFEDRTIDEDNYSSKKKKIKAQISSQIQITISLNQAEVDMKEKMIARILQGIANIYDKEFYSEDK